MKLGGNFDGRKLKRLVIDIDVIFNIKTSLGKNIGPVKFLDEDIIEYIKKLKEKYEIWIIVSSKEGEEYWKK